MKNAMLLAVGFTAVLSGCLSTNSSVDGAGNCKQNFIDDYNAVNSAYSTASIYKGYSSSSSSYYSSSEREAFQSLKGACDKFYRDHSGVSCKAEGLFDGKAKQVGSGDLQGKCDEAATFIARPAPTPTPAPVLRPTPTARPTLGQTITKLHSDRRIGDLRPSEFYIKILNEYRVTYSARSKTTVIQDGEIVGNVVGKPYEKEYASYCVFREKLPGGWRKELDVSVFPRVSEIKHGYNPSTYYYAANIEMNDGRVSLECLRYGSPVTVQFVSDTLGSIADLVIY